MVAILGFSKSQITAAVQEMYEEVAAMPANPFHFPVGRTACLALGYPETELSGVPAEAVASFAGVGYPFRAGLIRPGDTVLDIGAGAGTDSFIASRLAGEHGKVWALDITPGMLDKLQASARAEGFDNIETIEADAEAIPLPDGSVDVVTSNGALNLVPDKRRAFAEVYRVLRPEGRVQLADIVISRPVPLGGRSDPQLWAECVVGASIDEDYLELWREAGFTDIKEVREFDYFAESPSPETRKIASSLGARSIELAMRRPLEAARPSLVQRAMSRFSPRRLNRISARGLWGAVAALASVIACYGTLGVLAILSLLGVGLAPNEGLWAATVAGAAGLAVLATGFNLRRHRQPWPLLLAGLAAALIVYVMFFFYNAAIEAAGFALLGAAIALDLYLIYRAECVTGRAESGIAPPGGVLPVRRGG